MPYKDKEKQKEHNKKYYLKNKEKLKKYSKKYYQENKSKRKEYLQKNEERIRGLLKEYRQIPKVKKKLKEYNQRLEVRERNYLINKERRLKDINFLLCRRLRFLLNQAFRKYSQTGKIMSSKKYGINFREIILFLRPFPKDIENYHIDHIIPLSLFDFNNSEQIKIAFAPENHQWLTIQENLEKGNKLVMPHQILK